MESISGPQFLTFAEIVLKWKSSVIHWTLCRYWDWSLQDKKLYVILFVNESESVSIQIILLFVLRIQSPLVDHLLAACKGTCIFLEDLRCPILPLATLLHASMTAILTSRNKPSERQLRYLRKKSLDVGKDSVRISEFSKIALFYRA